MELYRWLFDVRQAIVLVVTTSCSGILFFTEPPPELIFFIEPPPELLIFLEPPPELLFFIDLPLHAMACGGSSMKKRSHGMHGPCGPKLARYRVQSGTAHNIRGKAHINRI
ncbi:hypothetical protein YC2023_089326 [Brassica napus]